MVIACLPRPTPTLNFGTVGGDVSQEEFDNDEDDEDVVELTVGLLTVAETKCEKDTDMHFLPVSDLKETLTTKTCHFSLMSVFS